MEQLDQILAPFSEKEVLLDVSTPQHKARSWIVNEEAVDLSRDIQVRQLYAMAVLYYETSGSGWKNEFGFMRSPNVCQWNDLDSFRGIFCDNDEVIAVSYTHLTLPTKA